jgi:hypothetical protein
MSPLNYGAERQVYVPTPGFPGEPTRSCVNLIRYKLGQISPRAQEQWNMAHGRHMAGLGGNETQPPWDPEFRSDAMEQLEAEDDVHGSGIFDSYGRTPTVNHDLGVFADHPSLPGFIDREVQYAVSKDIYDITSGADVVTVAGGGMSYQERGGLPVPFDWQGRKPMPPARALPPPTNLAQPYVSLLPHAASAVRAPGKPVFRPLPAGARRSPGASPALRLPRGPAQSPFRPVPLSTTGREVPLRALPTVAPRGVSAAVAARGLQVPALAPFARLPMSVIPHVVASRATSQVAMPSVRLGSPMQFPMVPMSVTPQVVSRGSIVMKGVPGAVVPSAMRGFGTEDSAAPGWGTYLFAGLLVGGAAAMFFGATKIKV